MLRKGYYRTKGGHRAYLDRNISPQNAPGIAVVTGVGYVAYAVSGEFALKEVNYDEHPGESLDLLLDEWQPMLFGGEYDSGAYRQPLGLPYPWQSNTRLKAAVEAYFTSQAALDPQELEAVQGYCLYVLKAPCFWESRAEEERLQLEASLDAVTTVEALRLWVRECVQFGVDPF